VKRKIKSYFVSSMEEAVNLSFRILKRGKYVFCLQLLRAIIYLRTLKKEEICLKNTYMKKTSQTLGW